MTDPFDALSTPVEPQTPRPAFAKTLRAQVVEALGLDPSDALPTIDLPQRSRPMTTTTAPEVAATALVPYLTVSDGARAIDWYVAAFGAVEAFRVVGDDGIIGHAELSVGAVRFMLSDEYPAMDVRSPQTLGGTPFALHLTVSDVDVLFARAVAAGATVQREPADQSHGSRQGTLIDPFGHRWMLSQQLEDLSVEDYAARSAGSGFEVVAAAEAVHVGPTPQNGGLWSALFYEDALAAIRQAVDVFGFEEYVVVTAEDQTTIVHSELRWPEGGIVQIGTHDPSSPYSAAVPGTQGIYCITADPMAVWERCQAAGLEVDRPPYEPHYAPGTIGFVVRDLEGNYWSFGSYGGGSTG